MFYSSEQRVAFGVRCRASNVSARLAYDCERKGKRFTKLTLFAITTTKPTIGYTFLKALVIGLVRCL